MLYLTVCDICWKFVWTNDTRQWKFYLHFKISGDNIFKAAQIPVARSLERPNFVRWRLLFCGSSVWGLLRVALLSRGIVGRFLDFWEISEPMHVHNFPVKEEQFDGVK